MDIEAATLVVCDRMDKRVVRLTWLVCWWVHVGLAIRVLLAVCGLELCLNFQQEVVETYSERCGRSSNPSKGEGYV
jgi:hypothetical protein